MDSEGVEVNTKDLEVNLLIVSGNFSVLRGSELGEGNHMCRREELKAWVPALRMAVLVQWLQLCTKVRV